MPREWTINQRGPVVTAVQMRKLSTAAHRAKGGEEKDPRVATNDGCVRQDAFRHVIDELDTSGREVSGWRGYVWAWPHKRGGRDRVQITRRE